MSTELIVNNIPFQYPSPGDEPGWGQAATGWASEVTTVLNTVVNPNDIVLTSFTIANNVTSPANITGFLLNSNTVRGAIVQYSVYILTTGSGATELAENGTLQMVYKNGGTIGSKWSVGRSFVGDFSGLNFFMTDTGQMQYTTTNVTGSSYTGVIEFIVHTTEQ